ncbi:hypothetical protein JNB84_22475 [Rhizobium pusense]|uniref:hypothetical protein n=1 Tax=Agrobacterium pusense TaxID=648995 RepID=UPI001C6DEE41|nr:hypothetical protein [Agrobacterium pusense]MBW9080731.1 hypothetical protein [Agrobacterium pusense]
MTLLHVDSSIRGQGSLPGQLSETIFAAERGLRPDLKIIRLKLAAERIGHPTGTRLATAQGAGAEALVQIADFAADKYSEAINGACADILSLAA